MTLSQLISLRIHHLVSHHYVTINLHVFADKISPLQPAGPAPEESKEEEECVQAPDGPRVKVYPQLAQYDMLSSPAQHCVLGLKHPVRQQVPQTVMHQVPRLQTLVSVSIEREGRGGGVGARTRV